MTVNLALRPYDDDVRDVARPRSASEPAPAPGPGPQVARVLALQRGAGNAAVARMLAARTVVARDPATAPADAAPGAATSPLADLATRAGSPAGLRALLAANPALGKQIPAYLATTNDQALNDLMAQAFAPVAAQPAADTAPKPGGDKSPTDPTQPLPADRPGTKTLDKGDMTWTLTALSHDQAQCNIEFLPDVSKVEAKNVSYGQTVVDKVGSKIFYAGATPDDPEKNKSTFTPFEDPATHKRMDHFPGTENDPFYGAQWDQGSKSWISEGAGLGTPGSSKKDDVSISATMSDSPGAQIAREGLGDVSKEFESVAMVLETRQPLGALTWGFKVKDEANAPIELLGGQLADCTDTPSADWGAAMDQFYKGKFEEILDDFDIAKAELKPDHKTKLDSIVTKMKAEVALKAQLGGAADLTGDAKFNEALSAKRAKAARDYLVAKGIDAARLEMQSYGADWARVEEEPGVSEGKNRRVQIWLH